MKKIATIAAIAVLTTLAACGDASAPTETPATEATNTEVVEAPAENTGGPCGDGTVLGENEKCK